MKRRSFLKISALTPIFAPTIFSCAPSAKVKFSQATQQSFALLEIHGSYNQIGYQIGKVFSKNLKTIIKNRSQWHNQLLQILDSREGQIRSKELKKLTQEKFPHILEEISGIADGAGLAFEAVWAMCIKSELLNLETDPLGCSSIYHSDVENNWLFHNEDGNAAYKEIMFVVKVIPPSGISFISMVYPGIITGNGPSLNSAGVVQTTNYIGSTKSELGLPRYVISRAILESKSIKEAVEIATMEPRSYPFHHHLASMSDLSYYSVETTPIADEIKQPKGTYFHTNHLLFERTKDYAFQDTQYVNSSSMSRFKVIEDELSQLDLKNLQPETFSSILSLHKSAPYSPCRHPDDDITGQTLGSAFFDLKKGLFRLFKGNPCEAVQGGNYVDYSF